MPSCGYRIGTAITLAIVTLVGLPACKKKVAPPPPLVTLRVGHLPVTGHAKFFVGVEEKFFEQEGLDVKLTEFANSAELMKRGSARGPLQRENTTLAVVATDARLTKVQATKLAQLAQHGLVRAISPVHTMSDGDLVIALSIGTKQAPVDALGVAAADAVVQAIVRAVRMARTLGGIPGLAQA